MYRFLVVEDDHTIRKGLVKIISKLMLPIETIYEAENGQDALCIARQYRPQVIITDIKMPALDGLDFIEQAKRLGLDSKFVILSGFSEFSFAQRAISYHVSEYLLKPIKKEKLYSSLSKVIEQLKQEEAEAEQKIKSEKSLREYHSVLLKEILEGQHPPQSIESVLSNAGITFPKEGFGILSIRCRSGSDLAMNFLDRYGESLHLCYRYATKHQYIIGLVNAGLNQFMDICLQMKQSLSFFSSEYKISLNAGISEWANTPAQLPELAVQAGRALDFRLLSGTTSFHPYFELKKHKILAPSLNSYYEELFNALNTGSSSEFSRSMDHFLNFLLSLSPLTPELIINSIENFIACYLIPRKKDPSINKINVEDLYRTAHSLTDFIVRIKQALYITGSCEKNDSAKIHNQKIRAALTYIENNYHKGISLEEVANYVNSNASYFSYIFKKETGMYFSDHLQKIRIEKSKALLMQPQYKIYKIAEDVGFIDEKYYFKIFKKLTGVTPNQYRNTVCRSDPP